MPQNVENKQLLAETRSIEELYLDTERILEATQSIKTDLARAIELLDLKKDSIHNPESFVDFGIMIALYYLHMHLLERTLTSQTKLRKSVERSIS